MNYTLILFSVLLVAVSGSNVITIDMEDIAMDSSYSNSIFMRSEAHGEKTVLLHSSDAITVSFCLSEEEVFLIRNVVYCTDGYPDQVNVFFDEDLVGQFTTHDGTDWGHLWNEFHQTGAHGMHRTLSPGQHDFKIYLAVADQYGVEIDYVDFEFSKSSSAVEVLCPIHNYAREVSQSQSVKKRDINAQMFLPHFAPNFIVVDSETDGTDKEFVEVLNPSNTNEFVISKN